MGENSPIKILNGNNQIFPYQGLVVEDVPVSPEHIWKMSSIYQRGFGNFCEEMIILEY